MALSRILPFIGAAVLSNCAYAQLPVGDLFASEASVHGAVSMSASGTTVLSGSSILSGTETALLRLSRGGELSICSGTRVSVTASASGRDLMFSFGEGTIQLRYAISMAADTVVTPDLRFLIAGPGDFDLAIGIAPNGDTCARSAKTSRGGVIVSETMGDGTYQVKPEEFVLFPQGRVKGARTNPRAAECGCPPAPKHAPPAKATIREQDEPDPAPPEPASTTAAASPSGAEYVEGQLSLAFNASSETDDLAERVIQLRVRTADLPFALQPATLPILAPETAEEIQRRGFWKKFGSWLAGTGYK